MEEVIEKIRDFVAGLFDRSGGGESVIGIDIGSSSIKIVQLRKKRGVAVLETYGELSLGPYAGFEIGRATNLLPEKLSEALNDLIREANVTSADAGLSIPFSSSLISLVEMPAVSEKQLSQMIPIEARKYIPVPISEVALDWFVVPQEESKYLTGKDAQGTQDKEEGKGKKSAAKISVLLVAIHKDALQKYQRVMSLSHLATSFYEIEIFSATRAVLESGIAPVAVVDFGAASTKIYIVEYGIVRLSHIINKGSQDITLALSRSLNISVEKAERLKREYGIAASSPKESEQIDVKETSARALQHIFSETSRVIVNYERKYNANVGSVVFTGGGATMRGFLPLAKEHFDAEVSLGDPFAKTEAPAFLHEVLREAGPEFSVAVGLALRKLQEAS